MSNRAQRRQRPQLNSEQLTNGPIGTPHISRYLNRQDALLLAVGFAVNLAKMWNGPTSPPFMQATVEKRPNGVSLHVEIIEATDESDAEIS